MTSRSLGNKPLFLLFLLAMIGCAAYRSEETGNSICLFGDDVYRQELKKQTVSRIPVGHPETILKAGEMIFLSFDKGIKATLLAESNALSGADDFIEAMDDNISRLAFHDQLTGCEESDFEILPYAFFEWHLSVVGGKWGAYERDNVCDGYCGEIGQYGNYDATDKLKISLYSYLYLRNNRGLTMHQISQNLKLGER